MLETASTVDGVNLGSLLLGEINDGQHLECIIRLTPFPIPQIFLARADNTSRGLPLHR